MTLLDLNPARRASIVWWNASAVHVLPGVLRDALAAVSASYGALVRNPVPPASAFRRAMSRRQGALNVGWRWEEIGVDPAGTIHGALTESTSDVPTRSWSASVKLVAAVDSAGAFMTTRPPADEAEQTAVDALRARYLLEAKELTQGDVRDLLLRILLDKKMGHGVRIKEGGSLYLLTAPTDELVADVAEAFALAGVHLRSMPVFADSLHQLQPDVRDGLVAEVAEVTAEVNRLLKSIDSGKRVLPSTIVSRRTDIDDLRSKAQLFRVVLAEDLANVERALADTVELIDRTDAALIAAASAALAGR